MNLSHLITPILSSVLDRIESLSVTVRTDGRKIYLDLPGELSALPPEIETEWLKLLSRHREDIIDLITQRAKAREQETSLNAGRKLQREYEDRINREIEEEEGRKRKSQGGNWWLNV